MRLSAISIDGFGIFHNTSFSDLPNGLVLFQGDNEAGKSTLLAFIRTIFFGFPDARTKEPNYPPFSGGQHGGGIEITMGNGQSYFIERVPGKGGGRVKVNRPDGTTGKEEELRKILGGATRELFKHIYAFSLKELQEIDTLQADSVKDAIYGASTGTAMLSLPRTINAIEQKRGELFKLGGQKPLINKKLSALEGIRSELREARNDITRYDDASKNVHQTEEKINKLNSDAASLRIERNRIDNYLKLWNDWIILQTNERDIESLPTVVQSFPEDGIANLKNLQSAFKELKERVTDIGSNLKELQAEAEWLIINEIILSESENILTLIGGKKQYAETTKNLPLNKQKLQSLDKEVLNMLEGLGKDWDEERARSIDRSLFTREVIIKNQERMNELRTKMRDAETLVTTKRAGYAEAQHEEKDAEKALEAFRDIDDDIDNNTVTALKTGRDRFSDVVTDIPMIRKELGEAEANFGRAIKDIDPDWDSVHIETFDTSIPAQKKVQEFGSLLKKGEQDLQNTLSLHEAGQNSLKDVLKEKNDALDELKRLPPAENLSQESLTERKSSIQKLRGLLAKKDLLINEINHQEERVADREAQVEGMKDMSDYNSQSNIFKWASATALVSGILIGLILIISGNIFGGLLSVIVFESLGAFLLVLSKKLRRRHETQKLRVSSIEKEMTSIKEVLTDKLKQKSKIEREMSQYAEILKLTGAFDVSALDALETELDGEWKIFDRYNLLKEEIDKIDKKIKTAEESLENALAKKEDSEKRLEVTKQHWKDYLKGIGLKAGNNPETVNIIFTKVDAVREQLKNIHEKRERICIMEDVGDRYTAMMRSVPLLTEYEDKSGKDQLSALDGFFEYVKENEDRKKRRELALATLDEKRERRENICSSLKKTEESFNRAKHGDEEALKIWKTWLMGHGFSGDFSPGTALEALQSIERLIQLMNEKAELTTILNDQEREIEGYRTLALKILERCGVNASNLSVALDQLEKSFRETEENRLRKREKEKEIKRVTAQLEQAALQVKEKEEEIVSLFKVGDSGNEETFRERAGFYENITRLLKEIEQSEKSMRVVSGETDLQALKSRLSDLTRKDLESEHEILKRKESEIEEELNVLRQTKTDLKHEIRKLASSEDISRMRAAEEKIIEEIHSAAAEWSRHTIASYLIKEARIRFEKEQQPGVIRDAGKFFKEITRESYQTIIAPIGENTIEVVTPDGKRKEPDSLSRGTAEQLYLAIRFGYISNFAAGGEPLPIIMDDILVNFDPLRAVQATVAIEKLAKTHQVLFFTCHPETVSLFKKVSSTLPLYLIENGQIKKP